MRTRFGRRVGRSRTFGSGVMVALGIGALAIIVLRMRRREAEETSEELHETTRERFGLDQERQTQRAVGTTQPLSNSLKAEAESTQEDDTQELTEVLQQRGREKVDAVIAQDTEGTDGSVGEETRMANGPVRLRPLRGQPMMSIIRGSVRRSRGGA